MCTFAATEIAQYYLNNASDVYLLLLDASKAFDTVEYVKLFKLLNSKGLCPLVTKLLLFYILNKCYVSNGEIIFQLVAL